MTDRRSFFKRSAGFLALAAVAKLPTLDEPAPIGETVGSDATTTFPALDTPVMGEREVVGFNVFGHTSYYSIPGRRQ